MAAENILYNFKGHLQVDGYEVYDKLDIKGMVIFFCMAHARRKIFDALSNDKTRAEHVLAEIAKLYKVEDECKEQRLDEEQIRMRRAEKSLPILKSLGEWMKQEM